MHETEMDRGEENRPTLGPAPARNRGGWRRRLVGVLQVVLPIVSIGVSVLALLSTHCNTKHVRSVEYRLNSVDHRPEFKFQLADSAAQPKYAISKTTVQDSAVTSTLFVTLRNTLLAVNTGNATASVLAVISGDTTSGTYWLREPSQWTQSAPEVTEPRFGSELVAPGDTYMIPIDHTFNFIDEESKGIMHCMLVYENELGGVFDCYTWILVRLPPAESVRVQQLSESTIVIRHPVAVVSCYKPTLKIYTLEEVRYLWRRLARMAKNASRSVH